MFYVVSTANVVDFEYARFISPRPAAFYENPKTKIAALAVGVLAVFVTYAGLTDRVNPIYPGVQIESGKYNALWPGVPCSAGVPIQYSQWGGSLGFLIASHCTDPGDWQKLVFQPYFAWAGDNNYAGYTVDWGTNNAYYELDRAKPDAAVWWVANRDVSYYVITELCGWRQSWAPVIEVIPDVQLAYSYGAWKIGYATSCTGSDDAQLIPDDRYSGRVYAVAYSKMSAQNHDSGGIVFRAGCKDTLCGVRAIGIVIGGIPPGGPPYSYTLVQSADYAIKYYGVYPYVAK